MTTPLKSNPPRQHATMLQAARIVTLCVLSLFTATLQPARAQEAAAPAAPKLVPALGWDTATQGGFTTCVTLDAQNTVWVGTEGKGIWRYAPREKKWTQFTTKDGLGDDCVYALAVDKLGRVWPGHLNHGGRARNGEKWKNSSILDGPLSA